VERISQQPKRGGEKRSKSARYGLKERSGVEMAGRRRKDCSLRRKDRSDSQGGFEYGGSHSKEGLRRRARSNVGRANGGEDQIGFSGSNVETGQNPNDQAARRRQRRLKEKRKTIWSLVAPRKGRIARSRDTQSNPTGTWGGERESVPPSSFYT